MTECPICSKELTFREAYALWDDELDNKLCENHKEWIDAISAHELKKERSESRMKNEITITVNYSEAVAWSIKNKSFNIDLDGLHIKQVKAIFDRILKLAVVT